ncbi:MAG: hypothetical protein M3P43_11380, partial [Actinomycetota bacterium]|nr:hypothetical protein [Actinomycetota bacterium]
MEEIALRDVERDAAAPDGEFADSVLIPLKASTARLAGPDIQRVMGLRCTFVRNRSSRDRTTAPDGTEVMKSAAIREKTTAIVN